MTIDQDHFRQRAARCLKLAAEAQAEHLKNQFLLAAETYEAMAQSVPHASNAKDGSNRMSQYNKKR
jgi:hypothetical protein